MAASRARIIYDNLAARRRSFLSAEVILLTKAGAPVRWAAKPTFCGNSKENQCHSLRF